MRNLSSAFFFCSILAPDLILNHNLYFAFGK